jgi:hypothetical protein
MGVKWGRPLSLITSHSPLPSRRGPISPSRPHLSHPPRGPISSLPRHPRGPISPNPPPFEFFHESLTTQARTRVKGG